MGALEGCIASGVAGVIRPGSKGYLDVVGYSVQYLTRYVDLGQGEGWEVTESGKARV
jgi:hypothetical protein